MTEKRNKVVPIAEGDQPRLANTEQRGYRPQAGAPLDPKVLKPPTGGTAIQSPKAPKGTEK
jgi:hypothetical protein